MRVLVAAAAVALVGAFAAPAAAETWTHPTGLYSFDPPAGWPVDTPRQQPTGDAVLNIAGTANNECSFLVMRRPQWSDAHPLAIRRAGRTPYTAEQWAAIAQNMMQQPAAEVTATSVDESGFWPIQRAQIQGPDGPVHAGVQIRPGVELWAYCQSYDGRDQPALYEQVIRSVGTPRDAEWRAAAEAAEAAAPPAE